MLARYALAFAVLFLSSAASAAGNTERLAEASPRATPAGTLSVLFTGDNAGEVDQCGCAFKPSGGLGRRKTAIERAAEGGPVLVLDAGNALFANTDAPDDKRRERAAFILRTMGKLGTRAMAVGARDLNAGPAFLETHTKEGGLTALSANLVDAQGKAVFAPSTIVEAGGRKIGIIGLSPAGEVGPKSAGLRGRPPLEALRAEARKLRGRADVLIALAALPYPDALQLLGKSGGMVDFIVQSHDQRGVTPLQESGGTFLVPGGDRGRQVGVLRLGLAGKGPFLDEGAQERERTTLARLESNITEVKRRLAAAHSPEQKAALTATLQSFERRRGEAAKLLAQGAGEKGRRRVKLEFWTLDEAFTHDPTIQAEAKKFGPVEAP